MAEPNKYLDYGGLVKVIELTHSNFPTKEITSEALDAGNQCLTELVEKYNEHTHSLENSTVNVSYSKGKLTINSSHNHTVQTISNDYLQTPPPALPESLRPNGSNKPNEPNEVDYSEEYFTLHMLGDGDMTLYIPSSYTTAPSYSLNGGDWTTLTSETTLSLKSDDKVRIKCVTDKYVEDDCAFSCTCDYEVYGNAMSLLYGNDFKGQTDLTGKDSAFSYLFAYSDTLKSAKNLILPATTLTEECYYGMFSGCENLTEAPELPATTLTDYCYACMFENCTSLTTAPKLPATTLAVECYCYIFSCCENLTEAPELPAITLADYCYASMFDCCTGLTTAPELPATTLSCGCYSGMFSCCESLTETPELPANILVEECYDCMFDSCTSLTTAPELLATTLADWCYSGMFSYCEGLTEAPELPATTLAISCYSSMFSGCTGLTTAPELPVTTLDDSCYSSMFYGCTSLTTAPELPATTLASNCYSYMFSGCTSLTTAPELPATTLEYECYYCMFQGCTSLTATPELPATILADWCYNCMFENCTSLTTAIELPATTLAQSCYGHMFNSCASLTEAPELPATTLASNCYGCMFQGCTSLTTAPELPATTLADYCYYSMFYGCSKLNKITMLATDISGSSCLYYWVNGVSSTGTFIKHPNMTSLPSGFNGIPSGWTVQDYQDSDQGDGEPTIDYSKEYFTLHMLEDGNLILNNRNDDSDSMFTNLMVSFDGIEWESLENIDEDFGTSMFIEMSAGSKLFLKNDGLINGYSSIGFLYSVDNTPYIISGNIMSLVYGDNFIGKTELIQDYCFSCLFANNLGYSDLVSAKHLILPATTLTEGCYEYMFSGCTSLTEAPELPATTLASYCYSGMFDGCSSLTTAPELPATTLASYCYSGMFYGCENLTTAPELPATTLANYCYYYMFYDCSKLNKITMLATDISASSCLSYWTPGVASSGTFIKHPNMTSLPTGTSGIPSGWTVQDYQG